MMSSVVVSSLVITACTGDDESTSWEMAAASSCTGWGGLICVGGIGICTGSVLLGSFCEVEGTGSGIPLFCGGIMGTEGGPDAGVGGGADIGTGGGLDAGRGGGAEAIVLRSQAHVSAPYLQLHPKWHPCKCQ